MCILVLCIQIDTGGKLLKQFKWPHEKKNLRGVDQSNKLFLFTSSLEFYPPQLLFTVQSKQTKQKHIGWLRVAGNRWLQKLLSRCITRDYFWTLIEQKSRGPFWSKRISHCQKVLWNFTPPGARLSEAKKFSLLESSELEHSSNSQRPIDASIIGLKIWSNQTRPALKVWNGSLRSRVDWYQDSSLWFQVTLKKICQLQGWLYVNCENDYMYSS